MLIHKLGLVALAIEQRQQFLFIPAQNNLIADLYDIHRSVLVIDVDLLDGFSLDLYRIPLPKGIGRARYEPIITHALFRVHILVSPPDP